uniref:Oligoribonuclease, mitochondrial n=1 Tax=Riptortus pedestris TaxID=329032 RepID=R4WKI4_RIPPE|nr:oligoribonuclease, mitochondrial [Riptortus pedestris]
MTGLDPDTCHILEIACLITDKDLNKISNIFHVVVNQPLGILNGMSDWCKIHHSKSGLVKESKASSINIKEAENLLMQFLKKYTVPGGCPLAGNTIYMDKLFLMKHLPKVADHLHYRLIDVSSISELCRRWYPNYKIMKKSLIHRAVPDVKESLAELKYFKTKIFPPNLSYEPDYSTQLLDMIGI